MNTPKTEDLLHRYSLLLEAYAESLVEWLSCERLEMNIKQMEEELWLVDVEDVIGWYMGE